MYSLSLRLLTDDHMIIGGLGQSAASVHFREQQNDAIVVGFWESQKCRTSVGMGTEAERQSGKIFFLLICSLRF